MRKMVARRLHDVSAQHLMAASLLATSLRMDHDDQQKDTQKWDDLERMIGMAMNELRLVMRELR